MLVTTVTSDSGEVVCCTFIAQTSQVCRQIIFRKFLRYLHSVLLILHKKISNHHSDLVVAFVI